jgi:hypothetical protein
VAVAWEHVRTIVTVLLGSIMLFFGIFQEDPAVMTVGAGLVGFSPAAKGP